ncbi:MAG: hypothetical protein NXI28_08920, partial [bacterium]|nr:hypothetical protein [bacterium]
AEVAKTFGNVVAELAESFGDWELVGRKSWRLPLRFWQRSLQRSVARSALGARQVGSPSS